MSKHNTDIVNNKKALLVGFFSEQNPFNGETTKAEAVKSLLEDIYGEVIIYNTESTKKHPLKSIIRLMKSLKGVDDVFLCVSVNGFTHLTKLIHMLAPKKRLFFPMVGQGPIFAGVEFPEGQDKNTLIDECIKNNAIPYRDNRFKKNKALLSRHSSIFYESETLKSLYENYYGIHNGCVLANFRDFELLPHVHSSFKEGEDTSFVYFSRIVKEKGIYDLLEVTDELRKEGFKFSLTIAGNGSKEDVDEVRRISERLENVSFIGPVRGYPVYFLSKFDCQLFPTTYREGTPGSLIESLFAGTPIISSSFAFCHDVVPEGGGIIFERGSKESLKMAMIEFLKLNEEERRSMSSKCLEMAKKFTKDEAEKILRNHL